MPDKYMYINSTCRNVYIDPEYSVTMCSNVMQVTLIWIKTTCATIILIAIQVVAEIHVTKMCSDVIVIHK